MNKKIIALTAILIGMMGWAGDSAPFLLDTIDPLVETGEEVSLSYNSSWVGGDSSAEVVISADETEIKRTAGEGEFVWSPTTPGKHTLTYTTFINGVAQDEIYTATVYADWKYTVEDGKATLVETTHTSGSVTIPSEIDGYPVVGIDGGLFAGCEGLTSVTIPDSVTSVGTGVFDGCTGIRSVAAPANLQIGSFESGLIQAKFNSSDDFTSSILDSESKSLVSGVLMGDAYDTESVTRAYTDPKYGGSHQWNSRYTTFGYAGYMYMVEGRTYVFGKYFDDSVLVRINGNEVLKNTDHTAFATGRYVPEKTGWYEIEVRIADGTGEKGPKGVQNSGYWSGNLGVAWRDDGITSALPESGWNKMMDPGDGSLFRIGAYKALTMSGLFPDSYAQLTNVTLSGVGAEISDGIFAGCAALESFVIPDSVTKIGANAFAGCASLQDVVIPEGVTNIGTGAFNGCAAMAADDGFLVIQGVLYGYFGDNNCVAVPDGVSAIDPKAFYGCDALKSVTMPLAILDDSVGMADLFPDSYAAITNVVLTGEGERIPANAFAGCASLQDVVIPDGVTTIGVRAFDGCSVLMSVTIPDSVTSIGDYAFDGCSGLTSVTIPDSVTSIGYRAFYNCSGITSVAIPDSVTNIGYRAFDGCSNIRQLSVPWTAKIGGACGLVQVKFDSNNDFISSILDSESKSLVSGVLMGDAYDTQSATRTYTDPKYGGSYQWNSVNTTFGYAGYMYMVEGRTYVFGKYFDDSVLVRIDGIEVLKNTDHTAFATGKYVPEETGWHEIEVRVADGGGEKGPMGMFSSRYWSGNLGVAWRDDGITSARPESGWNKMMDPGDGSLFRIGAYKALTMSGLFPDSYAQLTNVTLSGVGAEISDGLFAGCAALESFAIPNGVTKIGANAFAGCTSLQDVIIPDGVTTIGMRAFEDCVALTEIIVRDSVIDIGIDAFTGCTNLTNVMMPARFRPQFGDELNGCPITYIAEIQIGNGIWFVMAGDDPIVLWEPFVAPTDDVVIPSEIAGRPVVGITADAFAGNADITGIHIPDSVTDIEEGAFDGCTGIRSVHIPYVTDESQWMAKYFSDSYANITNVVLGGSVGRIGDSFFTSCEALSSVSIPAGLTNIARTAFSGCFNIASVIWCVTNECVDCGIPFNELFADSKASLRVLSFAEGVVSLPDGCLTRLEAVERVEFPSTLEKFGDNDLRSLSKVENGFWIEQGWVLGYMGTASGTVEIPEGVKGIASYAFEGQTLLDNVTLPSTLKYVGVNAFKSCTNLEDIDLPEGVVRVENGAFRNCTYAQMVKLPSSLQEIGDSAFENCTSFSGVECPDALKIIGEGAFSNCWRMLSVSLPVGLESVGTNAFLDCRRLIGVSTPTHLNTMKELFPSAYANLTTVEIAEGENALVSGIFAGCAALTEVDIPDGIRGIPEDAFVGCLAVQSFNLPNTITNIGARAFSRLTQMTSFAFPAEVETIADEAFAGCANLASLSLPEGVKHIGSRAFDGLALLARADIPGTVVEMGEAPFAGCGQIRAVSMPGNVATVKSLFPDAYGEIVSASVTVGTICVGERLFADCSKLTSVDLPSTLVEIGEYAFENCALLADAGIPASVERLGESAFLNCASLAKIALPNRLVTVPYQAFAGCEALAEIVIPENVSELEDSVFWGCSRLSKVYFVGNAPSCTASSYDGVPASLVTYVENGSTGWDGIETSKTLPEFWPEGTSNLITYWTPNRYDVTFDLSGGGDAFDVEQVTGTTYILPPDPERQGAVFDGWWTSADGGARVTAVTSVDLTRPHTFYARWKYNTYSVVFDANGGSGEMDEQRLTVETPAQLAENGFTRPGYEFLGWATAPDGEVVYSDKAEVVNLAYDNNAIVTLYAVWSEREWTWADAVNAVSSGLVFSGDVNNDAEWAIDYSTSHDGVASLMSGVIGASAEYPERTMSTVKTEVIGEGIGEFWWKVNCEEMDAENDEWYDYVVFTIDGEEVAKIAGDSGWQKVEYIITGAGKHTLAWTFTRDDYDEEGAGWENAAWLDEFVWTPNPVIVTFDAGGADGDVPDPVIKYAGYELTLPGAGTLNNGEYVFRGWSDGETTYQAGGTYVFGSVDVTLTAVWELKVWTFAEAADATTLSFTTGGDVNWAVDTSVGYTNGASVKSGAITNGESTWIETKVNGAGTLTFLWKVMGGQHRNNPFAYAKVVVDDTEIASEYLTDGWEEVSLTIEGNKEHTIRWTYLRTSTRTAEGDCAWIDAVSWTPAAVAEPIPALPSTATAAEVTAALEGSADAKLAANIKTAAEYMAYRTWALGLDGVAAQEVKDSPNAWLSYALDTDALIAAAPKEGAVVIDTFEGSATDGAFEFAVKINGIAVGGDALEANIRKVFDIEGTEKLVSGGAGFSPDNVEVNAAAPQGGNVKFTVTPKLGNGELGTGNGEKPAYFFFRVKMK